MAYDDEATYETPAALVSPGLQKRLALRRQRAAEATKPPSSGWLLELETLEQLLTCPMPADSWWSPSDFRRYLHRRRRRNTARKSAPTDDDSEDEGWGR